MYSLPKSVEEVISMYEKRIECEGKDSPCPIDKKISGLEETVRADPDFPRGSIGDHVLVDSKHMFVLELMDAIRSEKVEELYITESCFAKQFEKDDGTFCVSYRLFEREPEYEDIDDASFYGRGRNTLHPDTVLNKDKILTRLTEYKATMSDFGFVDLLLRRLGIDAIRLTPTYESDKKARHQKVEEYGKGKLYKLK
ncbi:hypothetical protein HN841_03680 [archaeon]|jgi:hypothetical protein|nr:hypothetical protein [archaeon]